MKKSIYEIYEHPTKEILDSVGVGDLVKISDWKKPYKVMAVSKDHFVMIAKRFKDTYYSICSKVPSEDNYNNMKKGFFFAGALQWNFIKSYDWNSKESMADLLNDLENPEVEDVRMSKRQGTISVTHIEIKRCQSEEEQ